MEKKQKIQLEDVEKRNVYTVPDQYFDNLSATIRRRINAGGEQERVYVSPLRYGVTMAAICLVLVMGWFGWQRAFIPQDPYQIISGIAQQDIIDYLQLYELAQYDLIETAAGANITIGNQLFQRTEISTDILLEEADEEMIQDFI
jgi:hypothetical protein